MHIAIVGAGLSGLATCWHLLQVMPSSIITLYAPQGIYGGSSGIAAGLLHPFVGAQAKLNAWGKEGMAATEQLLQIAEKALGSPVAQRKGILRVALTEAQINDYKRCVQNVDDTSQVEWYTKERCQQLIPGLAEAPGMMTHIGITVQITRYLEGLWSACQMLGASLEKQFIASLDDLKHHDAIIVATGASITQFPELSHLPIKPVKGQILELEWPHTLPPLACSINAQVYVVMSEDLKSCFVGSTYEKEIESEAPDLEFACKEILPKLTALFPPLAQAKVITCRAGIRATTADRQPCIGNITPRVWYITGMSSRGLLYHAWMAQQLATRLSKQL